MHLSSKLVSSHLGKRALMISALAFATSVLASETAPSPQGKDANASQGAFVAAKDNQTELTERTLEWQPVSSVAAIGGGTSVADALKPSAASAQHVFEEYCWTCHNDFDLVANLSVDALDPADLHSGLNADQWEKILRRVAAGEMPPRDKAQPDPALRAAFVQWVDQARARFVATNPDPGRATIRRLNRAEYANAVRDLVALQIDFSDELPRDNSGFGFDNIADALSVSPTLMERYLAVGGKVGKLATGLAAERPVATIHQLPKDGSIKNQGVPSYNERAHPALPLASRGGGSVQYYAPHNGEYEIAAWLNSNTNNETDRERADLYSVRVPLTSGAHQIGLSFRRARAPRETVQTLRNDTDYVPLPLDEPVMLALDVWIDGERRETLEVPSFRLHERYSQRNFPRDILQIDVTGPFDPAGKPDTPSTRAVFSCQPAKASQHEQCAQTIIARLARQGWRRSVSAQDIAPLMAIYHAENRARGFEHGIAAALEAILVSPQFLFAIERNPQGALPGAIIPLSDFELATRLSLFLWSSIPDAELLALAENGRLSDPAVLDQQVTRMLADPKARALTENFAGQWLHLRNLDQQRPDIDVFPAYDKRLKSAMARETELFFAHVLNANRPITDFIRADYTFLNARLADHYGVPGVSGTAFRKVALRPEWKRGGLLGQASILTVTSYNNHTSVVRRGKWVLDNILASSPPPPPPDIPTLEAEHDGRKLTAREQLQRHSSDPACASCHKRMDPIGFALENFDATGAWRTHDVGQSIDNSAVMPDGSTLAGIDGLQSFLLDRKDEFAQALTERMMTYALARGLVANDMPLVRAIAEDAAADDYRMQSFIRAIVASDTFRTRKIPGTIQTAQVPAGDRRRLP